MTTKQKFQALMDALPFDNTEEQDDQALKQFLGQQIQERLASLHKEYLGTSPTIEGRLVLMENLVVGLIIAGEIDA